jgi:hypothetical protein
LLSQLCGLGLAKLRIFNLTRCRLIGEGVVDLLGLVAGNDLVDVFVGDFT